MNAGKEGKNETKLGELTESQLQQVRRVNWLIPNLAIGYVPFVFVLMLLSSNDSFSPFYVFVYSGSFLIYAIPVYAIVLIWNAVKQIRIGTNTVAVTLYQLLSFIILVWWLLTVITFNGSPA